jgi:hypothetical protein
LLDPLAGVGFSREEEIAEAELVTA